MWIGLFPKLSEAKHICNLLDLEDDPESLHVTLAYMGNLHKNDWNNKFNNVRSLVYYLVNERTTGPIRGKLNGVGMFIQGTTYLVPDIPGVHIIQHFFNELNSSDALPFMPHMTFTGNTIEAVGMRFVEDNNMYLPLTFESISLCNGPKDTRTDFPLCLKET